MRQFFALLKKEFLCEFRTKKILVIFIISIIFGLMNPLFTKLTPFLLEELSSSLSDSGLHIEIITVSSYQSWLQFFKNIPIMLIIYILLENNIITKEVNSNTLITTLTKGVKRNKIIISKTITIFIIWTFCYFLSFFITYFYNNLLWEGEVVNNIFLSIIYYYFFTVWIVLQIPLISVFTNSNSIVTLGIGGIYIFTYLLTFIPKIKYYSPSFLMGSTSLINEATKHDFNKSLLVVILLIITNIIISIPAFNKKQF